MKKQSAKHKLSDPNIKIELDASKSEIFNWGVLWGVVSMLIAVLIIVTYLSWSVL